MAQMPHDTVDLLLAPVALELDRLLAQLGAQTDEELLFRIALQTDHEAHSALQRRALLLDLLVRETDTHGWTLSWDDRGLVLGHEAHALTLGLPASLRAFLQL